MIYDKRIHLMELLSENKLRYGKLLTICELIEWYNIDYNPLIKICYKLPSNKTVYEIRLQKRILIEDVKSINEKLKPNTKIRSPLLTLLKNAEEKRLEKLIKKLLSAPTVNI